MGTEIAQWREWNHDESLDWHLLQWRDHQGILKLVCDLNALYRPQPVAPRGRLRLAGVRVAGAARLGEQRPRLPAAGQEPERLDGRRLQLHPGGPRELPDRRPERRLSIARSSTPTPSIYGGSNVGNQGGVWAVPGAARRPALPPRRSGCRPLGVLVPQDADRLLIPRGDRVRSPVAALAPCAGLGRVTRQLGRGRTQSSRPRRSGSSPKSSSLRSGLGPGLASLAGSGTSGVRTACGISSSIATSQCTWPIATTAVFFRGSSLTTRPGRS